MPSDAGAVALPASIDHIGVVVEDIDKTMEFLSSIWGLGPWQTLEVSLGRDRLIVGEPFRQKLAWAKLGPTTLELIQQIEGGGPWPEFLQQQGGKMVVGGVYEGKRWCYFDIKPGGILVEFGES